MQIVKRDDPEVQDKAVARALKCLNTTIYFFISSLWGYCILYDSDWLPWYLGGIKPKASIHKSFFINFKNLPTGYRFYLFFTYGYHLHSTKLLLTEGRNSKDFWEYMVHHLASCTLYPAFLLSNFIGIGGVTAWLHDLADFWVNLSRLLNSIGYNFEAQVSFAMMLVFWLYTRLLILPIIIWKLM